MRSTLLKLLLVVPISAATGVSIGEGVTRARRPAPAPRDMPNPAAAGRPTLTPGSVGYHSRLLLNDANLGGPGELALHGVYDVGDPDLTDTPELPFEVDIKVRNAAGELLIENLNIGRGADKPGVGHWVQEFAWSSPFPAGDYYVELIAHLPGHPHEGQPGNLHSGIVGYCSRSMSVR